MQNEKNILEDFLESETNDDDLALGIIKFINCGNIRNGEYECNMYIVKKIDYDNIMLYVDLTDNTGYHHIYNNFQISRFDLQEAILRGAKKWGYKIPQDLLFDERDITSSRKR
ncbi:MAG: hypothetical protein FWE03_07445 [Firmicutes bacterium]|nr:hypothetical protein [Bacillota bacterium]